MKEDFGWISRTWRALRRIGEVARCGVRTTDQQVGCERRVLTLGARGGRRSTRAGLDLDHTHRCSRPRPYWHQNKDLM